MATKDSELVTTSLLKKNFPKNILETLAENKIFVSERGGNLRITPHLWNNTNDFERFTEILKQTL